MTQAEKINELAIQPQIDSFYTLFSTISKAENGLVFLSECGRIKIIIDFVNSVFHEDNLELLPLPVCQNIRTWIININNHLTNYQNSKNQGYFTNANNEAENILINIPALTFPQKTIARKTFESSIDSIVEKTAEYDSFIEGNFKKITEEISANKKQLDAIISASTQTNTVIEQQKTRLDTVIQSTQTEFSTSQKERDKDYSYLIADLKTQYKSVESSLSTKMSEKIKELIAASQDTVAELESKKEQAAKLVGIISNIIVTGDYNKHAVFQKKKADILRIIAIVFMALLAGGAIWIIFSIKPEDFDWKVTLVRLLATSILTVPAAYAARESSKHRKLEIKYRKMELELASLDPFMESLPEKEQNELKHNIIDRVFGRDEEISSDKDDVIQPSNLIDLLRDALKALGGNK